MAEDKKKEIAVIEITEEYMKDRLYEFRGKKVMLDSDLAEIYGYETKNFKRQVKNNIAKFEGDDFMFELNDEEVENLSRCKNFTLKRLYQYFDTLPKLKRIVPPVYIRGKIVYNKENVRLSGKGAGSTDSIRSSSADVYTGISPCLPGFWYLVIT